MWMHFLVIPAQARSRQINDLSLQLYRVRTTMGFMIHKTTLAKIEKLAVELQQ